MDQTTRQNAAVVEEATTAASNLQAQSRHLEKLIETFKIPVQGTAAKKHRQITIKSGARDRKAQMPQAVSRLKGNDSNPSPDSKNVPGLPGPRTTTSQASVAAPASGAAIGSFQTSAGPTEEWEEF